MYIELDEEVEEEEDIISSDIRVMFLLDSSNSFEVELKEFELEEEDEKFSDDQRQLEEEF